MSDADEFVNVTVERRYDEGELFTLEEFQCYYDTEWQEKWDQAEREQTTIDDEEDVTDVVAADSNENEEGEFVKVERRHDTDGELYTKEDFEAFYGGTKEWDQAPREHPEKVAEPVQPTEQKTKPSWGQQSVATTAPASETKEAALSSGWGISAKSSVQPKGFVGFGVASPTSEKKETLPVFPAAPKPEQPKIAEPEKKKSSGQTPAPCEDEDDDISFWKCTKCGKTKKLSGEHLKSKKTLKTSCDSKNCSYKSKMHDRVSASAAALDTEENISPKTKKDNTASVKQDDKKDSPFANPFGGSSPFAKKDDDKKDVAANPFGNSGVTANPFGSSNSFTKKDDDKKTNPFGGSNPFAKKDNNKNDATTNPFGNPFAKNDDDEEDVTANPFGSSGVTANPFGSSNSFTKKDDDKKDVTANPFRGSGVTANPFGSGENPFAKKDDKKDAPAANPFGSSNSFTKKDDDKKDVTANPFGSSGVTANPFGSGENPFAKKDDKKDAPAANPFGSSNSFAKKDDDKKDVTANPFGSGNPFAKKDDDKKDVTANPFGSSGVTANPFGSSNSFAKKDDDKKDVTANPFGGGENPFAKKDDKKDAPAANPFSSSNSNPFTAKGDEKKDNPSNPFGNSAQASTTTASPFNISTSSKSIPDAGGFFQEPAKADNPFASSKPTESIIRDVNEDEEEEFEYEESDEEVEAEVEADPPIENGDANNTTQESSPFKINFGNSQTTTTLFSKISTSFSDSTKPQPLPDFGTVIQTPSIATPQPKAADEDGPAAIPTEVEEANESNSWKCTSCGSVKTMSGDHLKKKKEVKSQCNSKKCCFKKKTFVKATKAEVPTGPKQPPKAAEKEEVKCVIPPAKEAETSFNGFKVQSVGAFGDGAEKISFANILKKSETTLHSSIPSTGLGFAAASATANPFAAVAAKVTKSDTKVKTDFAAPVIPKTFLEKSRARDPPHYLSAASVLYIAPPRLPKDWKNTPRPQKYLTPEMCGVKMQDAKKVEKPSDPLAFDIDRPGQWECANCNASKIFEKNSHLVGRKSVRSTCFECGKSGPINWVYDEKKTKIESVKGPFVFDSGSGSGGFTFDMGGDSTSSTGGGFFDQKPTTTTSGGFFDQKPNTDEVTPSTTTGGFFDQKPTTTTTGGFFDQKPNTDEVTPSTTTGGFFDQKPTTTTTGGFFDQKPTTTTTGGFFDQKPTTTSTAGFFDQKPDTSKTTSTAAPAAKSEEKSAEWKPPSVGGIVCKEGVTGSWVCSTCKNDKEMKNPSRLVGKKSITSECKSCLKSRSFLWTPSESATAPTTSDINTVNSTAVPAAKKAATAVPSFGPFGNLTSNVNSRGEDKSSNASPLSMSFGTTTTDKKEITTTASPFGGSFGTTKTDNKEVTTTASPIASKAEEKSAEWKPPSVGGIVCKEGVTGSWVCSTCKNDKEMKNPSRLVGKKSITSECKSCLKSRSFLWTPSESATAPTTSDINTVNSTAVPAAKKAATAVPSFGIFGTSNVNSRGEDKSSNASPLSMSFGTTTDKKEITTTASPTFGKGSLEAPLASFGGDKPEEMTFVKKTTKEEKKETSIIAAEPIKKEKSSKKTALLETMHEALLTQAAEIAGLKQQMAASDQRRARSKKSRKSRDSEKQAAAITVLTAQLAEVMRSNNTLAEEVKMLRNTAPTIDTRQRSHFLTISGTPTGIVQPEHVEAQCRFHEETLWKTLTTTRDSLGMLAALQKFISSMKIMTNKYADKIAQNEALAHTDLAQQTVSARQQHELGKADLELFLIELESISSLVPRDNDQPNGLYNIKLAIGEKIQRCRSLLLKAEYRLNGKSPSATIGFPPRQTIQQLGTPCTTVGSSVAEVARRLHNRYSGSHSPGEAFTSDSPYVPSVPRRLGVMTPSKLGASGASRLKEEVEVILEELSLDQIGTLLDANDIRDLETLRACSKKELIKVGVSLGQATALLNRIRPLTTSHVVEKEVISKEPFAAPRSKLAQPSTPPALEQINDIKEKKEPFGMTAGFNTSDKKPTSEGFNFATETTEKKAGGFDLSTKKDSSKTGLGFQAKDNKKDSTTSFDFSAKKDSIPFGAKPEEKKDSTTSFDFSAKKDSIPFGVKPEEKKDSTTSFDFSAKKDSIPFGAKPEEKKDSTTSFDFSAKKDSIPFGVKPEEKKDSTTSFDFSAKKDSIPFGAKPEEKKDSTTSFDFSAKKDSIPFGAKPEEKKDSTTSFDFSAKKDSIPFGAKPEEKKDSTTSFDFSAKKDSIPFGAKPEEKKDSTASFDFSAKKDSIPFGAKPEEKKDSTTSFDFSAKKDSIPFGAKPEEKKDSTASFDFSAKKDSIPFGAKPEEKKDSTASFDANSKKDSNPFGAKPEEKKDSTTSFDFSAKKDSIHSERSLKRRRTPLHLSMLVQKKIATHSQ